MPTFLTPLKKRVDSFLGKNELHALKQRVSAIEERIAFLQRNWNVSAHPALAKTLDQRTAFRLHESKTFSQNGEDGILLHIFETIGTQDRRFFEIGVQDGRECNSANLSLEFGWGGVLVEGDSGYSQKAAQYYDRHPHARPGQVKVLNRFVSAENINAVVAEGGLTGEIDLVSIDVDGIDLWLWKALDRVKPRVVVMEYNAYYSWDKAITVKYEPDFSRYAKHPSGYYFGASLAALKKLGETKGYALVACDSKGVNAFFVRKDLAQGKFRDLPPEEAYYPLTSGIKKRLSAEEAYALVSHLPFETL